MAVPTVFPFDMVRMVPWLEFNLLDHMRRKRDVFPKEVRVLRGRISTLRLEKRPTGGEGLVEPRVVTT